MFKHLAAWLLCGGVGIGLAYGFAWLFDLEGVAALVVGGTWGLLGGVGAITLAERWARG
tara:strand:- start:15 stop:191 length:177 start_codon:yes stop_codon:yes gene_type:complete